MPQVLPDCNQITSEFPPCDIMPVKQTAHFVVKKKICLTCFGQNVDQIHLKVSSGNRCVCKASFRAAAAASAQENLPDLFILCGLCVFLFFNRCWMMFFFFFPVMESNLTVTSKPAQTVSHSFTGCPCARQ